MSCPTLILADAALTFCKCTLAEYDWPYAEANYFSKGTKEYVTDAWYLGGVTELHSWRHGAEGKRRHSHTRTHENGVAKEFAPANQIVAEHATRGSGMPFSYATLPPRSTSPQHHMCMYSCPACFCELNRQDGVAEDAL